MSYYNIRNMKYQNCNSQRMFAHAISFLLHQEPYITALKCEIKPSTHLACSRVQMFFTLPMLVASNSTRKPVSTLISKIITNNTWSTVALLNYSVIPPITFSFEQSFLTTKLLLRNNSYGPFVECFGFNSIWCN